MKRKNGNFCYSSFNKRTIENAASAANRNVLSFLPILGEGKALLVGVDFPMPLFVKIDKPINPPNLKLLN